jgi:MFS family permease
MDTVRRAELIDRAERGNAINWTTYSTLQGLSASFISADLFNTVLMRQGASDFVLGLFAANQLVSLASQFVAARYVDGSRDKVRLMWLSHVIQLLPILLPIALLALTGGQVGLWPFFGAVFFYYLVNSTVGAFGSIANMDLLSRVLRPSGRGKLLGMQGALGGLAGIASGLLVAGIIGRLDYPLGYTTVWCTGLILSLCTSVLLLRLRQLPGLRPLRRVEQPRLRQALRAVAKDRRFAIFLIAVVARMGFSATQYYIWPTARRVHGLPDEYVGYIASVNSAITMCSAPLIGWLADRLGRAQTALLFAAVAVVGFALFPHAESQQGLLAAYVLISVGASGITMPLYLSVLDLSPSEQRGLYVAVRYGTESGVYALFLPLFGYFSTHFTPHVIFYAGAMLAALSGIVLFNVAEGRKTVE